MRSLFLSGSIGLFCGVGEFLAEAFLTVEDEFFAVEEERGAPGDAQGCAVGDVSADPVFGLFIRHDGVVGSKVQAQVLREGPEQGSLRVLFFAPLGLGFEQPAAICSYLPASNIVPQAREPATNTQDPLSAASKGLGVTSRSPEPGQIVPHLLDLLRIVSTFTTGATNDFRGEHAIRCDLLCQTNNVHSSIVGVLADYRDACPIARMPFDGTTKTPGSRFDFGAAVRRIQNQGLRVPRDDDWPVDVGLDVVIERIVARWVGYSIEQPEPVGRCKVGRLEDTVGITEGAPVKRLAPEPEIAGSEARSGPVRIPVEIQRPILRAGLVMKGVVDACKQALLPHESIAARMSGQPAIADACLELRQVRARRSNAVKD